MSKKLVTLRLEVDMDKSGSPYTKNKDEFFENQVLNVTAKLLSMSKHRYSKYSSEEGETDSGSKFKVMVKKIK